MLKLHTKRARVAHKRTHVPHKNWAHCIACLPIESIITDWMKFFINIQCWTLYKSKSQSGSGAKVPGNFIQL